LDISKSFTEVEKDLLDARELFGTRKENSSLSQQLMKYLIFSTLKTRFKIILFILILLLYITNFIQTKDSNKWQQII